MRLPRIAAWCLLASLLSVGMPATVGAQGTAPTTTNEAARQQYVAARALQNRELFDAAAEEWETFLKKFATDPLAGWAQHYLGVCRLQNKEYDKAQAAFLQVIRTYPKFDLLENAWYLLSLSQFYDAQAGKPELFEKAGNNFATLSKTYPKGQFAADALFYQAECFYHRDKLPEAVALYGQLAKAHPQNKLVADALYAQGVAQQTLSKPAEAAQTFAAFLKQFPKHMLAAEVSMRRGETLLATGQTAEAEKLLAAAAATPGFVHADHALVQQAGALASRNQPAEAAALYASAATKHPQSKSLGMAQLGAGKCYYLAGRYSDAREWLAKVVSTGSSDAAEASHWLARGYLKENQPAEALQALEAALPKAGMSSFAAQLLLDKADALYEIPNRRAESVKAYADLASRHPQDVLAPQALYMAGFASLGLADYKSAIAHADAFNKAFASHSLAAEVKYVAAESRLLLSEYPQAEALYKQLLDKHPQHLDAAQWRLRHGLSLFLQKKHAEAAAALQGSVAAFKKPELAAEAHYLVGASQSELKQFAAAATSLEASLKAQEDWRQADETLLLLSHAQKQNGNAAAAVAALQKLITKFPESKLLDRAHYRWGEYAYAANDYKKAAEEYQRVVLKWPKSSLAPSALLNLGWSQLGQQDYAAAEKSFTTLVGGYPQDALLPRARYARALARQQLKQYAPAIEDIQAFLQSKPTGTERSDALYVLGLCQGAVNKPADAVATYQSILTEDPKYAGSDKVLYELAWSYKALDKQAEAADAFSKLATSHEASPLAAESLYHAGEHAYNQEHFKDASKSYFAAMNKAGKTDLGEKSAHKLGWAYYRLGDFVKAQQTFGYQRTTFPQGTLAPDATFMESESLFKQGKHAEALALFEQVKNPSSADFQALALLHGGQAACQLKQWSKGLALLDQSAKQFPESPHLPEVLYEQAWAKQNLGQIDEALTTYEAVTAKTNREVAARARFMIGEIHFERKDHKQAVTNFYKAAYGYSYPEWQANALYEAARCLEVLKKVEQAKKDYQEVVTKFPQSDKAAPAQKRLAELK